MEKSKIHYQKSDWRFALFKNYIDGFVCTKDNILNADYKIARSTQSTGIPNALKKEK